MKNAIQLCKRAVPVAGTLADVLQAISGNRRAVQLLDAQAVRARFALAVMHITHRRQILPQQFTKAYIGRLDSHHATRPASRCKGFAPQEEVCWRTVRLERPTSEGAS